MGGNALKQFGVERLAADAYHSAASNIVTVLRAHLPDVRFDVIESYADKESFGDLDILYSVPSEVKVDVIEEIKKLFSPTGYVKNSNLFSWAYQADNTPFQVDMIRVPVEEHDFALQYFNFNDLGNLLGRVFHKQGFKLGHNGMLYVVRDVDNPSHAFDELVVTRDWALALEFGDYVWNDSTKFKTKIDLFEYTATSKYFSPDIYLLENRTAKGRIRDKKRQTYMDFLLWLEQNKHRLHAFDWTNKSECRGNFLQKALEEFPEFNASYQESMRKFHEYQEIKAKFNGDLVMAWTGLENQELGNLIRTIRLSMGEVSEWSRFVLANTAEEVKLYVMSHFDQL